jgi:hypothetical protein
MTGAMTPLLLPLALPPLLVPPLLLVLPLLLPSPLLLPDDPLELVLDAPLLPAEPDPELG